MAPADYCLQRGAISGLPFLKCLHYNYVSSSSSVASGSTSSLVSSFPVLPVVAATHGGKGDLEVALEQARPEIVLAAPGSWCPNPAYTSCLRVRGRSMMPLLHDGYIIVADKSQTYRRKLYGQIVVAAHQEQGLIVSRLQRFDGTEVLVPENREYDSIAISSASWRIVAKILWWIGRASQPAS